MNISFDPDEGYDSTGRSAMGRAELGSPAWDVDHGYPNTADDAAKDGWGRNDIIYPRRTYKDVSGGDFGATWLRNAGGFVETVMQKALASGNNCVGDVSRSLSNPTTIFLTARNRSTYTKPVRSTGMLFGLQKRYLVKLAVSMTL